MTPTGLPSKSSSSVGSGLDDDNDDDDAVDDAGGGIGGGGVGVTIEYCSACRWMLRGTWIASELLTTFVDEPRLERVTLVPRSPPLAEGGIFRVCAHPPACEMNIVDGDGGGDGDGVGGGGLDDEPEVEVLWDRKARGRFPEAKEVKQRVRDRVSPARDLGHSDVVDDVGSRAATMRNNNDPPSISDARGGVDCAECKELSWEEEGRTTTSQRTTTTGGARGRNDGDGGRRRSRPGPTTPPALRDRNHVSIEYSAGGDGSDSPDGDGLHRAAYYANELLGMTYERNAWWKRMEQRREGGDGGGGGDLDASAPPAVVDGVSLIPNRTDRGILVSRPPPPFSPLVRDNSRSEVG
jgi:selenoprotein W-related protein